MAIRVSKELAKQMGLEALKRGHKYSAVSTVVDGVKFASKREARRYSELKLLEKAGKITDIELQPVFILHAEGGKRVCEYRADFSYWDQEKDCKVVEDAKGFRTAVYKLKRDWLMAEYGIEIREV